MTTEDPRLDIPEPLASTARYLATSSFGYVPSIGVEVLRGGCGCLTAGVPTALLAATALTELVAWLWGFEGIRVQMHRGVWTVSPMAKLWLAAALAFILAAPFILFIGAVRRIRARKQAAVTLVEILDNHPSAPPPGPERDRLISDALSVLSDVEVTIRVHETVSEQPGGEAN